MLLFCLSSQFIMVISKTSIKVVVIRMAKIKTRLLILVMIVLLMFLILLSEFLLFVFSWFCYVMCSESKLCLPNVSGFLEFKEIIILTTTTTITGKTSTRFGC